MGGLFFLLLMGVFFYFFIVRPQQNRVKQHNTLVSSIEVGDEVVTAGGMVGYIKGINERDVMIEIAPSVVVRVVKGAIAQKKPIEAETTE